MNHFWEVCLNRFERKLSAQQFRTWIKPLRFKVADDGLTLVAPNRFVLQWIRDKFLRDIEEMASAHFSQPFSLSLALDERGASPASLNESPPPTVASAISALAAPAIRSERAASRLNPLFSFDSFVAGKANQMARAAAIQVAERPGVAYNPLFVYGGVGLGKTHLIQAIGNAICTAKPTAKIRYIHAEAYVTDVVRAYQHKAFDDFKRYYHSLGALLVDDIQFLGNKNRTQEEFFYAFNALIEAGSQVIITCDSYPKEISNMEDRLISRFGWGLTVSIEPPELEMRVAILLKKAEVEAAELDESSAFFIAKHIQSNIRELEGALKRVLAYARFHQAPVSAELCREALKDLLAVQMRQVSVDNIQKTVADFYNLKVAEMYSKKRSRLIARPRQVAMALARELTQLSLPEIGEAFGGRDHTTVLHAHRKVAELRETETSVARDYSALLQMLRG